jgi:hypothetical protein
MTIIKMIIPRIPIAIGTTPPRMSFASALLISRPVYYGASRGPVLGSGQLAPFLQHFDGLPERHMLTRLLPAGPLQFLRAYDHRR